MNAVGKSWGWQLALALLLAVMPMFAAARDDALAQLQARITMAPELRADFEQEKHLKGFRNPLRSKGRILVVRDRGVVWTTLAPFPSELVLTDDRIVSRNGEGRSQVELDAREQPAIRAVNAMLFALLRGDVRALEGAFELQPTLLGDGQWRLALTPKPGILAKAFRQVTLEGASHVDKAVIEEASGDRTTLVFRDHRHRPAELSPEEARHFD